MSQNEKENVEQATAETAENSDAAVVTQAEGPTASDQEASATSGDATHAPDDAPDAAESTSETAADPGTVQDEAPAREEVDEAPEDAESSSETPSDVSGTDDEEAAPDEQDSDETMDQEPESDGESEEAAAATSNEAGEAESKDEGSDEVTRRTDVTFELKQLLEYTTKYSEIGPTVAELCIKLGHRDLGDRILRMGQGEGNSMEYFFVAGDVARREGRADDVLQFVLDALDAYASADPNVLEDDDASRLLHLVRLGFAALMFDIGDVNARPEWTQSLAEKLEAIESRYDKDAFFHTLFAQALWLNARERSEEVWDKAAELDDPESTWNARGTWYKEAEADLAKAESAYRRGIQASSSSPLLMHNLAQVLLDRAESEDSDAVKAAGWVHEADGLLHKARKRVRRRGLRRHIHLTIDRLKKMRPDIEEEAQEEAAPEVGDIVEGKVENVKNYGAFIALAPGVTGLLHKSEIAHDFVKNPGDYVKKGQTIKVKVIDIENRDGEKGLRIGLSRKALLPKDNKSRKKSKGGSNRKGRGGTKNRGNRNNRGSKPSDEKLATLGELLLAKMEDKEKDKN